MPLNDFSNVQVTGNGPTLSQVGFGTLLCAAYFPTARFPERTRTYTALSQLASDGFLSTDPAYRMVQRVFQQNPKVGSVKLGRLANASTMLYRITPLAVNSAVYELTIEQCGKAKTTVSYTADGNATVDEICDGLQAAIEALDDSGEPFEGLTVTPDNATATYIQITAAAGVVFYLSGWRSDRLKVEDRTPDAGIAADLDAIRNYDDDWYGLATDQNGRLTSEEAADWAETQLVVYGTNTSDWLAYDNASTTDIQSVLAAKSYIRTIVGFDNTTTDGYFGAGMLAERFPSDPGRGPGAGGTFHGKTIAGVSSNTLTPTEKGVLETKGYTIYVTTAKRAHTLGGKSPSGEFLDKTRFVDWFVTRTQEGIAQVILDAERVPFTDGGISQIESVGRSMLDQGITAGGIMLVDPNGEAPKLVMPKLSDISDADRGNRLLGGDGMQISFYYTGAIHKANVSIAVFV